MKENKYTVKCYAYGEQVETETISRALAENRVVKIQPIGNGEFDVIEMCDGYYCATLTAEQLAAWGRELIELSKQSK